MKVIEFLRCETNVQLIGKQFLRSATLMMALLWSMPAHACNVPVFRYALERWTAESYQAIVFHREPLNLGQQALLETMEKMGQEGRANIAVSKVNLLSEMSQPMRSLWQKQEKPSLPWMVVQYPRQTGIEHAVWAGPLSDETVESVLNSPVRQDLAQKLLNGESIVWLLLESGEKLDDEEMMQRIEVEMLKLEKILALPEPSPFDPPMNLNLPLKISFSTVRVSRANPAERMLVNMLLRWDTNLTVQTEAMLFPVFGRGRIAPPAIGKQIRGETMHKMAEFITGPCSCEIKELNHGCDLLLAANWDSLAGYQEMMLPELPPLVGMSQFAAAAAIKPSASSTQSVASLAPKSASPPAGRGRLVRNLIIVLGIVFVLLVATTLALKAKAVRRSR